MKIKKKINDLIQKSGLENKEVLAILDELRKEYHKPMNVGDKGLSERELSKMVAKIKESEFPLSKDKGFVYYRGGWRKVYTEGKSKQIIYLKLKIDVTFKKKSN